MYDIVGGGCKVDCREYFYTIGKLIELCDQHPEKVFKFVGTNYSPNELGSWRGSYDLPSIDYTLDDKTGVEVSKKLSDGLEESHYGYKGGEYTYYSDEEFYVAEYGISDNIRVVGYEVEGNQVTLLTKRDPY
jgi:hypothetical protein